MLLQIEQMRDEREDLVQKAINLKQNIKTLKAELIQRENIAEALKRQNRELRHTLNLRSGGKDLTPKGTIENNSMEGPNPEVQKSKTPGKYTSLYAESRISAKTEQQRRASKTPVRVSIKTIDDVHRSSGATRRTTPGGKARGTIVPSESDARLH